MHNLSIKLEEKELELMRLRVGSQFKISFINTLHSYV